MFDAALASAIAALGLVAGYVLFDRFRPSEPFVGRVMGLGAGVLMAVVAYALVLETAETSERPSVVGAGMAVGALIFYYGSGWLDQRAASSRSADDGGGSGLPLTLGAVLDGVPESMVIGIAAALTGEIGVPLVIAAFIANIAESLAATPKLESGGLSRASVLGIWVAILTASVATAVIGYEIVSNVVSHGGAVFNGFAAGAVLMVLSTSLIPDGYQKAQRIAGLMVVIGFSIGFALEHAG